MKKILYLNLILCLLLFSGCANKQEMQSTEAPESEEMTSAGQDSIDHEDDISNAIDVVNTITEEVDFNDDFRGINGCAVIYDVQNDKYSVYNPSLSEKEASPYSTFKIISTLAGLKNGVIENETSTMNYSGAQYPVSEWNENLTLENAFQTSCIWFFRQIIDEVGSSEIQNELIQLGYGNCDISEWDGSDVNPMPDLNGFWLGSSLKISPYEQVQVLKKIFEGESIYSDEDISILKSIMLVSEDPKRIYGKTGSGPNGEAWFVGFSEEDGDRKYFAIYLNDHAQQNNVSGNVAKEIGIELLKKEIARD